MDDHNDAVIRGDSVSVDVEQREETRAEAGGSPSESSTEVSRDTEQRPLLGSSSARSEQMASVVASGLHHSSSSSGKLEKRTLCSIHTY